MEPKNVNKVSIRLDEAVKLSTTYRKFIPKRADRKIAERMSLLGFNVTISSSTREPKLSLKPNYPSKI